MKQTTPNPPEKPSSTSEKLSSEHGPTPVLELDTTEPTDVQNLFGRTLFVTIHLLGHGKWWYGVSAENVQLLTVDQVRTLAEHIERIVPKENITATYDDVLVHIVNDAVWNADTSYPLPVPYVEVFGEHQRFRGAALSLVFKMYFKWVQPCSLWSILQSVLTTAQLQFLRRTLLQSSEYVDVNTW